MYNIKQFLSWQYNKRFRCVAHGWHRLQTDASLAQKATVKAVASWWCKRPTSAKASIHSPDFWVSLFDLARNGDKVCICLSLLAWYVFMLFSSLFFDWVCVCVCVWARPAQVWKGLKATITFPPRYGFGWITLERTVRLDTLWGVTRRSYPIIGSVFLHAAFWQVSPLHLPMS